MDKIDAALAVVVLGIAIVGSRAVLQAGAWERRVHDSEAHANALQSTVDSLELVASEAEASAAHKDTVRVTLTKLIPQTDSATHPDSTCTRSLAARDAVIAADSAEIGSWSDAFHAEEQALAKLTARADTLQAALSARPRAAAALELLHPSVHLSLQLMAYPEQRIGVGLSLDLVRIRL